MGFLVQSARHRAMLPVWDRLHRWSLIGMNYWASELDSTGEREALKFVSKRLADCTSPVVFDVGANVGKYAQAAFAAIGDRCRIYAFEPSESTFEMLEKNLTDPIVYSLNKLAFSDEEGEATLHSSEAGSTIASLVDLDRPIRPFDPTLDERVTVSTIDRFCDDHGITTIDFLKLDIEGHELSALRGAKRMLGEGRIRLLQFEFGENNMSSRTFLADFEKILSDFDFYRVVPGGPIPWRHEGGRSEIFATMNYLCVRR